MNETDEDVNSLRKDGAQSAKQLRILALRSPNSTHPRKGNHAAQFLTLETENIPKPRQATNVLLKQRLAFY